MNLELIARRVFDRRLTEWGEQNDIPVEFANKTVDPPDLASLEDFALLQAYTIPGATVSRYLEGTDRQMSGLYQINILTARNIGAGKAGRIAAQLADLFILGTRFVEPEAIIQIRSPLRIAAGIAEESTYTVPVDFDYLVVQR